MALTKREGLERRHQRVRRKIAGTAARPRLCIHKSLRHLYAQVIDDDTGRTLCFATTNTKAAHGEAKHCANIAWAKKLGAEAAQKPGPPASRRSSSTAAATATTASSRPSATRRARPV